MAPSDDEAGNLSGDEGGRGDDGTNHIDPLDAAIRDAADGDTHAGDIILQLVGASDLLDDDVPVEAVADALSSEPPASDDDQSDDEGGVRDDAGDGEAGKPKSSSKKHTPVPDAVLDRMLYICWDVEVYDNNSTKGGCCSIGAVSATGGEVPECDPNSDDWFHEYVWPKPEPLDSRNVHWNPHCIKAHKIPRKKAHDNGEPFLVRWAEMMGWMLRRREQHAELLSCDSEDVFVCLVAHNGESCDFTWLWRELSVRPGPENKVQLPSWVKYYWDTYKTIGEYKGSKASRNPFWKKGSWDKGLGMEALARHYGLDTRKCHRANWDSYFNCVVSFKPSMFQVRKKANGIGLLSSLWGRKQAKLDKVMAAIGHAVRDDWDEKPNWLSDAADRQTPAAPIYTGTKVGPDRLVR